MGLHNALLENRTLHRVAAHMLLVVARRRPRRAAPVRRRGDAAPRRPPRACPRGRGLASDTIALRYVLLVLALAVAALAARGRRALLVLGAVVFVEAVLAFWTASLARPYGLFVSADVTRAAAEVSAARLPGDDGALSGEPRLESVRVRLAQWGLAPRTVMLGPSLLPLFAVPALGLLVFALWRRGDAAEAAVLWLAFSTAEPAALRGEGFLTGLWSHPAGAIALVVVAAAALAAGRLRSPGLGLALGLMATLGLAGLRQSGTRARAGGPGAGGHVRARAVAGAGRLRAGPRRTRRGVEPGRRWRRLVPAGTARRRHVGWRTRPVAWG